MKEYEKTFNKFKDYLKKIDYLNSTEAVLYWDMRTVMPRQGVPYRGEVLSYISEQKYNMLTSDTMKYYIDYFESIDDLDIVTKACYKNCKKVYDKQKKIPKDRYIAYTLAASESEAAWEEAKEEKNYEKFKPHLQKIINFQKEFVEYLGYTDDKYNTLLDDYEPGITASKLDVIFSQLRDAIIDILNKIKESKTKINTDFLKGSFDNKDQEKLSLYILDKMGYDMGRGALGETMHPFTIKMGSDDVRLSTHYYQDDFKSALYSCIHEGGHGIYDQNIDKNLYGTLLSEGASMGIHESQSRFYENIIGRSLEFWKYFYSETKKIFPQFNNVSVEDFYKAMNEVKPSLVRTESDELTYSLHIIIRYELERELINGTISVDGARDQWNKKYKDYLGVTPKDDSEGILQDMHWSDGSFGYFPSYALGNLYGAQFLHKMEQDIPDLYSNIENGSLLIIKEWLNKNIHKYGSLYKPEELIKSVTGEELSSKYFIDYLYKKYSKIYNF